MKGLVGWYSQELGFSSQAGISEKKIRFAYSLFFYAPRSMDVVKWSVQIESGCKNETPKSFRTSTTYSYIHFSGLAVQIWLWLLHSVTADRWWLMATSKKHYQKKSLGAAASAATAALPSSARARGQKTEPPWNIHTEFMQIWSKTGEWVTGKKWKRAKLSTVEKNEGNLNMIFLWSSRPSILYNFRKEKMSI